MADTDKRPDDIDRRSDEIIEETMRGIFDDINNSGEFNGTDDAGEEYESGQEDEAKAEEGMQGREADDTLSLSFDDSDFEAAGKVEDDSMILTLDDLDQLEADDADMYDDEPEGYAGEDDSDGSDDGGYYDDSDDGYEEEDTGEIGAEKELKNHKRRKMAGIITAAVLGVLLLVYVGFAWFFNSHFLFFTKINGTDFSLKNVEQVEDYMKQQVADYVLTMEESDGSRETVNGADISLEYVPGTELKELVKKQNAFFWIQSLWKHPEIKAEVGVRYDEAALSQVLGGLSCMAPENQTESVDARPEFQETEFVIVPEVVGTQINAEKFNEVVASAVKSFDATVNLLEDDCYIKPRFVSDSEQVVAARDAMNSYLGASITYDFNPHTEVVDATVISQWVRVDADMNVTFDQEAVKAYIQTLAEKYNTKGKTRTITTASGNTANVEGGSYGWRIDQEAEYNALTANIQNAETVTREPNYSSRAASHDGNDFGSTYAEIDLTNQQMYFIRDGQVALQSPIVTGNPNKGYATPQGTYSLAYKARNQVLRGAKKPDGTYEYESPVSFWMPFNGGIGFHDATWQSAFGGSRYQTNGSHGCVNMPYNMAAQLYDLIDAGFPVVAHF